MLLERFEKVTGKKPHRFMRRGIVFSHREFDIILDRYERGEPFFLYTGRGTRLSRLPPVPTIYTMKAGPVDEMDADGHGSLSGERVANQMMMH